ncbi:hypothetical protein TrCOL_g10019 [Triparma columacea]|uniref:Gamma-glutamylcyclotransferase family protein n=1 Tax=Triparma columacea TaxID=722753 RepID=A0A9W7G9A2_9STRA|nr:hypothetical protein TrCOL_g10019 [Triparma columacea]
MKLSWFIATSSGRVPLRQLSYLDAVLTCDLLMSKPISTPSFTIFPSTSSDPEAYTEGTAKSARDFVMSLVANGRNLELYSGDRYMETVKGKKEEDQEVGVTMYSYEVHISKPKFPIVAKILSTPKSRDAMGKLVKEAACVHNFNLSVKVNAEEDTPPPPPATSATTAAAASALPADMSVMVAMAYSKMQSLERRVVQLESESTRKDKVISSLQKSVVDLHLKLAESNPDDRPPYYAFVYGTLKRGFFNYEKYLGEDAEFGGISSFVTSCKTAKPMKLVVGDFGIPYLLDEQDDDSVQVEGEIFEIDTEKRFHLDYLEGVGEVGDWYDRVKIPVIRDDNGEEQLIDAYISVGARGRVGLNRGVFSTYPMEIHDSEYVNKDGRAVEDEQE